MMILLRPRIEVAACGDAPEEEELRYSARLDEGLHRSILELVDAIPGLIATSVGPRPLVQLQALDCRGFLLRLT